MQTYLVLHQHHGPHYMSSEGNSQEINSHVHFEQRSVFKTALGGGGQAASNWFGAWGAKRCMVD